MTGGRGGIGLRVGQQFLACPIWVPALASAGNGIGPRVGQQFLEFPIRRMLSKERDQKTSDDGVGRQTGGFPLVLARGTCVGWAVFGVHGVELCVRLVPGKGWLGFP
jgi:hypothetical protein